MRSVPSSAPCARRLDRLVPCSTWVQCEVYNAGLQTCHLQQAARKWHAVIQCAEVPATALPATGRQGGFDLGVANLVVDSDGQFHDNLRWFEHGSAGLAEAQRCLATKKRGSNRRRKAGGQAPLTGDETSCTSCLAGWSMATTSSCLRT